MVVAENAWTCDWPFNPEALGLILARGFWFQINSSLILVHVVAFKALYKVISSILLSLNIAKTTGGRGLDSLRRQGFTLNCIKIVPPSRFFIVYTRFHCPNVRLLYMRGINMSFIKRSIRVVAF